MLDLQSIRESNSQLREGQPEFVAVMGAYVRRLEKQTLTAYSGCYQWHWRGYLQGASPQRTAPNCLYRRTERIEGERSAG
jgi:hypothetical protein